MVFVDHLMVESGYTLFFIQSFDCHCHPDCVVSEDWEPDDDLDCRLSGGVACF